MKEKMYGREFMENAGQGLLLMVCSQQIYTQRRIDHSNEPLKQKNEAKSDDKVSTTRDFESFHEVNRG